MTVTANTTRNDYVGNGQSVYSYTFQLNDASDLAVYLDGYLQTLNTNYTVSGVGNSSGGTIEFTLYSNGVRIHPQSTDSIAIVMEMDLDRDTNYQSSGAFLSSEVNNDFDRLWLATNQQQTRINRSIHLSNIEPARDMFLPSISQRANKILAFDANGNVTTSTGDYNTWNTAYNNMITSASFSGGNYTLTQQDGGTISTSLDGRYHKIGTDIPNADISQSSVTQHQGALSITESQISDLGNYLPLSGGTMSGDIDFGANKAKFVGLEIYNTIGNTSVIEETGAGNLNIKGQDVRIQTPANEDVIKGEANGAVTLYYDNAPKIATTNTGVSVTGTLSATGYNDSNWNDAYNNKITAVNYSGTTLTLTQQDGGTLTTTIAGGGGTATGVDLADNVKATFGADDDLEIYHQSSNSNSIIKESGGGILSLQTNGSEIGFFDTANNQHIAWFKTGAECSLRYNGSERFKTTSTGIDVTGSQTTSGNAGIGTSTIVDSKLHLRTTSSCNLRIEGGDPNSKNIVFVKNTGGTQQAKITAVGENLYFTTGTTHERMRIDSAGNVGIGTSSPERKLHIQGSGGTIAAKVEATDSNQSSLDLKTSEGEYRIINHSNQLRFYHDSASTERMRIDASGNVGIGTSTIYADLQVHETSGAKLWITANGNNPSDAGRLRFAEQKDGFNYFEFKHDGSANKLSLDTTNGTIATFDRINQRVGIGETDPATELDVSGDITLSGSINGNTIFKSPTGATEYARFNSSGWLGLGDSSPSAKLHVQQTSTASGCSVTQNTTAFFDSSTTNMIGIGGGVSSTLAINFGDSDDADSGRIYYRNSLDQMAFYTLANERMTIDQNGNVGVGTTVPLARMHLKKYSTASGVAPYSGSALFLDDASNSVLQMGAAWYGVNTILFGKGPQGSTSGDNDIGSITYNNYSNYLAFNANASERLRINSLGNVLIGTTSAGAYSAKLNVNGRVQAGDLYATSAGSRFLSSGFYGSAGINVEAYTDSTGATVPMISFKNLSGTQQGSITVTGSTTAYNTSSDERLKENIKDAEDAGDKIDAIQVRQFDWKDGGKHQDYGVIAQELDKVAPEAVTKGETEDDMMSVDYSKLVPTLIKEIQSLRNRVAELEKN